MKNVQTRSRRPPGGTKRKGRSRGSAQASRGKKNRSSRRQTRGKRNTRTKQLIAANQKKMEVFYSPLKDAIAAEKERMKSFIEQDSARDSAATGEKQFSTNNSGENGAGISSSLPSSPYSPSILRSSTASDGTSSVTISLDSKWVSSQCAHVNLRDSLKEERRRAAKMSGFKQLAGSIRKFFMRRSDVEENDGYDDNDDDDDGDDDETSLDLSEGADAIDEEPIGESTVDVAVGAGGGAGGGAAPEEETDSVPQVGALTLSQAQQQQQQQVGDLARHAMEALTKGGRKPPALSLLDTVGGLDLLRFMPSKPHISQLYTPPGRCLPRKDPSVRSRATLVLDLDGTLVRSVCEPEEEFSAFPRPGRLVYSFVANGVRVKVATDKRPYLDLFLDRVAELFEVVVFTAAIPEYADRLLNQLDPKRTRFRHRIFQTSCSISVGMYVKNLDALGRSLSRLAILDDSPLVFSYHLANGIPIRPYNSELDDEELLRILPFMERLSKAEDVRIPIREHYRLEEQIQAIEQQRSCASIGQV